MKTCNLVVFFFFQVLLSEDKLTVTSANVFVVKHCQLANRYRRFSNDNYNGKICLANR